VLNRLYDILISMIYIRAVSSIEMKEWLVLFKFCFYFVCECFLFFFFFFFFVVCHYLVEILCIPKEVVFVIGMNVFIN